MVWVSSVASKEDADCLYSRQVRNYGLGVLHSTCKEYVDCLYSRQVRNQNGLGVHHGACKRVCRLPLLQTSQKLWSGCPPRHLQQSMRTASAPVLFESCQVRIPVPLVPL